MKMQVFEQIIQTSREDNVRIAGGEIFFNPRWREMLSICDINPVIKKLTIVTSGSLFYYNDGRKTKIMRDFNEIVNNLENLDIQIILSNDKFHIEQFTQKKLIERELLINLINNERWNENISLVIEDNVKINPVGRALETEVYTMEPMCRKRIHDDFVLNVDVLTKNYDPNGNVYLCWNLHGCVGNYMDSDETIFNNYKKLKKQDGCKTCSL